MTDGIFAIIKFMLKCNLAHNKYERRSWWTGWLECVPMCEWKRDDRRAQTRRRRKRKWMKGMLCVRAGSEWLLLLLLPLPTRISSFVRHVFVGSCCLLLLTAAVMHKQIRNSSNIVNAPRFVNAHIYILFLLRSFVASFYLFVIQIFLCAEFDCVSNAAIEDDAYVW